MGESRLSKTETLRTDREYREVVRRGERASTAHFAIYRDYLAAVEGTGGTAGRKIGISVGRKVGKAVVRNRIKRLLREFCRQNKRMFPAGSRTAIVARKSPGSASLESVSAELLPAIERRWGTKGEPSLCRQETSR